MQVHDTPVRLDSEDFAVTVNVGSGGAGVYYGTSSDPVVLASSGTLVAAGGSFVLTTPVWVVSATHGQSADLQLISSSLGSVGGSIPAKNVQTDYGATGDGATDDTTAIQNALDALNTLGGGLLVFPKGTYVVTSLTPRSNVSVLAVGGATIQQKAGSTSPVFYRPNAATGSLSNVRFRDLRIEGDTTAVAENNACGIYLRSAVTDVWVTGCKFNALPSAAIHIDGLRVHVKDNTATSCVGFSAGRNAINIVVDTSTGSTAAAFGEVTVTGNVVDTTLGAGIALVTIGASLYVRATVSGNTVRNASGFAGIVCEANGSAHQVAITGNNISRSVAGIEIANTGGTVPQPADHQVFTISGNTIDCEDLAGAIGVTMTSSYSTVTGNTIRASSSVVSMGGIDATHRAQGQVVSNNTLIAANTSATIPYFLTGNYLDDASIQGNRCIIESGASARGLNFGDTNRIHVSGNHLNGSNRDGINLNGGAVDSVIEGNVIFDVNAANSTFSGIVIAGSVGTFCAIRNNTVIDRRGTPQMKYALDVSGVTSGPVRVISNTLLGAVTATYNGKSNVTVDHNNLVDAKGSAYWDDFDGQTGRLAPSSRGWNFGGGLTMVSGRAFYVRYVPRRNETITKIGFVVTTADAGNPAADVGIYDSSLNKIVSSGATTGVLNAAGTQAVTITTTTLTAGTVYYIAISTASATAQLISATIGGAAPATRMFGSGAPAQTLGISTADTQHPLPATGAFQNSTSAVCLAVRES